MNITGRIVAPYLQQGEGLAVRNPASGEVFAHVRDWSADEVRALVKAAHAAMPAWAAQTAKQRSAVLMRWRRLILDNEGELARLMTAECGKPLAEAHGEVAYAASFIEWFAEEAKRVYGDVIPSHVPGRRILVLKQPVGVCAAITPWNFPAAMITRKAAPALATGCAMVVKPAEATPLSALALEALAREAGVPEDVFRVAPTTDEKGVGAAFCADPNIRKLSFTGSTAVGKLLMAQCAGNLTRLSLELGGNAPFIVFDDADLDAAVDGALVSKYRNAGQTCVCANRFLVQDAVHDVFVEKFVAKVGALTVGDGAEPGVQIGPLINPGAVEKVDALVKDAIAGGAAAATGGTAIEEGRFFSPTILTGVDPEMNVARQEIFGPVAPVIRFRTEEDAIALANDTPYGLAAYFYARDMGRIWRVMEGLEYGMVGVNEGAISTEVAPFGGVKESGLGREGSRYGIDEYVELKYCLLGGLTS